MKQILESNDKRNIILIEISHTRLEEELPHSKGESCL